MILTERKHKACALNLDGRKVLTYNTDKTDIHAGSAVVKLMRSKNSRRDGLRCSMRLGRGYDSAKDGVFYLTANSFGLSGDDWWTDYVTFAEEANAPVAEPGDSFAILVYSPKKGTTEVHTVTLMSDWKFEEDGEKETMARISRILNG